MAECITTPPSNATTLCSYAIVVCATPLSVEHNCSATAFYGCSPSPPACEPTVYADCFIESSGIYTFLPSLFENETSECALTTPNVTLECECTVTVTNINLNTNAGTNTSLGFLMDSNVTAYGGSVIGSVGSLWAHTGTDVSGASVHGPYFGGSNVTTMPLNCSYLACDPPDANATTDCAASPGAVLPLGGCVGTYDDCIGLADGQTLCVSETCEWVQNASDYSEAIYHFPQDNCRLLTVCEHFSGDAIFPDDATCLCLPGYTLEANGTCTIITFPDVVCGENQYLSQLTYECIDIKTCEHGIDINSSSTSDAVCSAAPTVCVGLVNSAGICVTPTSRCTSVQYVDGTHADGTSKCVNLSPPCTRHEIETKAPTATTDRQCKPVASQNMVIDAIVILIPTAVYILATKFVSL